MFLFRIADKTFYLNFDSSDFTKMLSSHICAFAIRFMMNDMESPVRFPPSKGVLSCSKLNGSAHIEIPPTPECLSISAENENVFS